MLWQSFYWFFSLLGAVPPRLNGASFTSPSWGVAASALDNRPSQFPFLASTLRLINFAYLFCNRTISHFPFLRQRCNFASSVTIYTVTSSGVHGVGLPCLPLVNVFANLSPPLPLWQSFAQFTLVDRRFHSPRLNSGIWVVSPPLRGAAFVGITLVFCAPLVWT